MSLLFAHECLVRMWLLSDAARDTIRRYKMDQLAAVRSIRGSVAQAEELKAQCARTQGELEKLRALVRHTMATYKPLARTSGPLLPSQVRIRMCT
jgi:hypothetical protein